MTRSSRAVELRRSAATLIACALTLAVVIAQGEPPSSAILKSVCGYVADYEHQLAVLIGEEDYTQLVFGPSQSVVPPGSQTKAREVLRGRCHLRSEFALLNLPTDEKRWIGVRDVFEVDGRAVADRSGRLSALLKLPFGTAEAQWRALNEESSRFNIGGIRRTINVPTFVLLFLRCENQHRFAFDEPQPDGTDLVVGYREVKRPTFIRDEQGEDELARGFIRASASGAVVATRLVVGLAARDVRAQIDVRYRSDPKLGMIVPDEMREQYWAPSGQRVEGVARYRRFQRFEVEATWRVRP